MSDCILNKNYYIYKMGNLVHSKIVTQGLKTIAVVS